VLNLFCVTGYRFHTLILNLNLNLNLILVLVLISAILFLPACDNSVDPLDRDTGIFSIYGYLDLDRQTHYIRVKDLNAPFTAEATRQLDALVTFRHLESGQATVLEAEVREHMGVYLHTFVYQGTILPDNAYQVTAVRSDGATVDVSTRAPTRPDPTAEPGSAGCLTPVVFRLGPLNGGTVVLRFGAGPGESDPKGPPVVFRDGEDTTDGFITYTFIPQEEADAFRDPGLPVQPCYLDFYTGRVYLIYTHYSAGFHEQIAADPFDIFASTQRFGALYTDTFTVELIE
jgi:hypothetical protein